MTVRCLACLLFATVLIGCGQAAPATARPQQPSVTLDGTGSTSSASVRLEGGYAISWTAPAATAGCYHGARIEKVGEDNAGETIVDVTITTDGRATGTSSIHALPAGEYYVHGYSDCGAWSFTFTPTS